MGGGVRGQPIVFELAGLKTRTPPADTATIRGRVTDPDGIPLEGVLIRPNTRMGRMRDSSMSPRPVSHIVTDTNGEYDFRAVTGNWKHGVSVGGGIYSSASIDRSTHCSTEPRKLVSMISKPSVVAIATVSAATATIFRLRCAARLRAQSSPITPAK